MKTTIACMDIPEHDNNKPSNRFRASSLSSAYFKQKGRAHLHRRAVRDTPPFVYKVDTILFV